MGRSASDEVGRTTGRIAGVRAAVGVVLLVAVAGVAVVDRGTTRQEPIAAEQSAVEDPQAADECGPTILKADGTEWHCTMTDDFDGTELDRDLWVPQTTAASGFRAPPSCVVDAPGNISVADGVLSLTTRQEAEPFICIDNQRKSYETTYTSASVSTFRTFSQTYGRFEMRAKLPAQKVRGLHSAFWLWPVDALKYGPWPYSGEIDVAEWYSAVPDRAIPFIHYVPDGWDWNVTNNYCLINDVTAFHTYVVEWTDDTITVLYDGKVCIVDDWFPAGMEKPAPFDHPFMVALTQGMGFGQNSFVEGVTPLPATMQVDHVRVWE